MGRESSCTAVEWPRSGCRAIPFAVVQVHLMDPTDPFAPPLCVAPRREGLEYFVEHSAAAGKVDVSGVGSGRGGADGSGSGGRLVLLTNSGSQDGEVRLMTAAPGEPER